jgi:phosphonate transport system substrate-binding protein
MHHLVSLKFLFLIAILLGPLPSQADHGIKAIVTAAFVSDKGLDVYQGITDYLSKKLQHKVSLITGTSYEESNMLLERGIVQIGFVCGLPFTQKARQNKLKLLAMPVMAINNNQFADTPSYLDIPGKYYSYTIVQKNSNIQNWEDLQGKTYVYNDQNSNSGYNMPRYKLIQLGAKKWEDYFSNVMVSGSHEESIRMVSRGHVDASSVDSLVLDYDRSIADLDALNVRVIEALFQGGAGIPPVVVSHSVNSDLQLQLKTILTTMHEDPDGRKLLSRAMIAKFSPPDDANYDDIRKMESAAHKAGFIDHVE